MDFEFDGVADAVEDYGRDSAGVVGAARGRGGPREPALRESNSQCGRKEWKEREKADIKGSRQHIVKSDRG